jgi:hypothetical protein
MSDSLLDAKAVAEQLMVPSAFLSRGDLATLGLGRAQVDAVFRRWHGRLL